MDPCALYGSEETIKTEIEKMTLGFEKNHVCNLGHGVYPDTPLDNVKYFVNTIKEFRY
jgi:uroporphyrinogen decarboxylase